MEQQNSGQGPLGNHHVLIVEDSVLVAMAIEDVLIEQGFSVAVATSLREARTMVEQRQPAAALLDLQLPDGFSGDLARQLADTGCMVALCSAFDADDVPDAGDYAARFSKPVSPEILAAWVNDTLRASD